MDQVCSPHLHGLILETKGWPNLVGSGFYSDATVSICTLATFCYSIDWLLSSLSLAGQKGLILIL